MYPGICMIMQLDVLLIVVGGGGFVERYDATL